MTRWLAVCSPASGRTTTPITGPTGSSAACASDSTSSARRRSPAGCARSTLRARGADPGFARTALTHGARLAVLSAFALAQPLLDILGKNPEFVSVRRSSSTQIVLFALFLVFVPPAALLAAELLVRLVDRRAGQALHLLFVAGLVAVVV